MDYGFHHINESLPEKNNEICLIKHSENSRILVSKWNGHFYILDGPHPNGNTPSYHITNPEYWKSCDDIKNEIDQYMYALSDEFKTDSSEDNVSPDSERNNRFSIFYGNFRIGKDKKDYLMD